MWAGVQHFLKDCMCTGEDSDQYAIRAVGSKSPQGTMWVAKDPKGLHADSEDSDQTARMRLDVHAIL